MQTDVHSHAVPLIQFHLLMAGFFHPLWLQKYAYREKGKYEQSVVSRLVLSQQQTKDWCVTEEEQ